MSISKVARIKTDNTKIRKFGKLQYVYIKVLISDFDQYLTRNVNDG